MAYALITGASKGIGKSIAEELASMHYDVLLIARSTDLLQESCIYLSKRYNVQAKYLAIDLSEDCSAKQIFEWCRSNFYDVQILVNNAGYGLSGSVEKYTIKDSFDMLKVNMTTPVELCMLFLPQLKKHSKAYILNISSTAAYQALPGFTLYAASKSFILNFTRGLHQELRKSSVSASCLCPGSTDTEFSIRSHLSEKAIKNGRKLNMSPKRVARIAVRGMLAEKPEFIAGIINRVVAFMSWLLPKSIIEKAAMKIYE